MRLSVALLYPRMWINMRGKSWFRHRKRAIPDDANFTRIIASGYNVVDAKHFVETMSPLYMDYESLPELKPRFPTPPAFDQSHPDWHEEPCKVFNDEVFPIEGVQQALAFTKGVRMGSGLPDAIAERVNSISFTEDEDNLAQRIVQQAFLWDAYLEKLPKLKDLDFPSLIPRRDYGIPLQRSNNILCNNFLRLIESKVPSNTSLSKMVSPQEEMRVNLHRHGSRVQFKLNPLAHIVATSPIHQILTKQEVGETQTLPLSDISPFLSTANLEEENIYKNSDHFAVPGSSKFANVHTSIFSHHIPGSHTHIHPRWNDDRFTGATIMYNFSTALLMARRKYGIKIRGSLPEPITTQVIHMTGKEFQFSVMQLNTLNLDDTSPSGIKNNVWVTDKINLFSQIKNYYGKEIFEGYNPEVLKYITAMYLS